MEDVYVTWCAQAKRSFDQKQHINQSQLYNVVLWRYALILCSIARKMLTSKMFWSLSQHIFRLHLSAPGCHLHLTKQNKNNKHVLSHWTYFDWEGCTFELWSCFGSYQVWKHFLNSLQKRQWQFVIKCYIIHYWLTKTSFSTL